MSLVASKVLAMLLIASKVLAMLVCASKGIDERFRRKDFGQAFGPDRAGYSVRHPLVDRTGVRAKWPDVEAP